MKKSLILVLGSLVSFSALAGVSDVSPSTDRVSPSTVQRVTVLKNEGSGSLGISLVQANNGGSSDISSAIAPSRLYLTLHQNGEMFDVEGTYLVVSGLIRLSSAKLFGDSVRIKYTYETAEFKTENAEYTIFINEAVAEAAKATLVDGATGPYELKATVGMKNANP